MTFITFGWTLTDTVRSEFRNEARWALSLMSNFCFPLSTEDMHGSKYELITIRLHSCEKVYALFFSQQSLMRQNTKIQNKDPLIIKRRRGKKGKEKMAWVYPIFLLLLLKSVFFTLFWIWFKLSLLCPALDLEEKEGEERREREREVNRTANLMCNHYVWTLCA